MVEDVQLSDPTRAALHAWLTAREALVAMADCTVDALLEY